MVSATWATLIGFSLIAVALATVFFSPYRHGLGFMFAGMVFWGILVTIRFNVQNFFDLSVPYSYLTAIIIAMSALIVLLLRADRLAQKTLQNRQYIEHTPVYEED